MSRRGATAAILAAALAGLVALPGAPGSATSPAPAAAADCIPVAHSKTVVKRKKVRRNGKWVKVKRKRVVRWTTCDPVPPPATCSEPSANLGVFARDSAGFTFTLSRPCVNAGMVTVQLNNTEAEDPHTLALRPLGASEATYRFPGPAPAELEAGETHTEAVELTAGDWYLWCDLPTHEEAGMNATLAVR